MDLIITNAHLSDAPERGLVDIGISGGRIAALAPALAAEGERFDACRSQRRSRRRMAAPAWALPDLPWRFAGAGGRDGSFSGRHRSTIIDEWMLS